MFQIVPVSPYAVTVNPQEESGSTFSISSY